MNTTGQRPEPANDNPDYLSEEDAHRKDTEHDDRTSDPTETRTEGVRVTQRLRENRGGGNYGRLGPDDLLRQFFPHAQVHLPR